MKKTFIIEISYQFKGATTMYVGECKGDFCPVAKAYAKVFLSIKAAKDYINANKVLFHGLDSKIVTA